MFPDWSNPSLGVQLEGVANWEKPFLTILEAWPPLTSLFLANAFG